MGVACLIAVAGSALASDLPPTDSLPDFSYDVQLAPGHFFEDRGDVPKSEQFGTGQLVDLASVAFPCERGGGDIGNVIGIDVAFADVGVGHGKGSAQKEIAEEGFGEVLVEPSAANDRRRNARAESKTLAEFRFLFAAPGENNDSLDALCLGCCQ